MLDIDHNMVLSMSHPRSGMHSRVKWAAHEEDTKTSMRRFATQQFKERDLQQSILDAGKVKAIKQFEVPSTTTSTSYTTSEVCAPKTVAEVEDSGSVDGSGSRSPKPQTATRPPRHTSSKYDFVKVHVCLGDNTDHHYVLSRFLVSRMLTVTKIPNHGAVKIALELKKMLVDSSLLDISHSDLEVNLFNLMKRRGYGAEYVTRYKMMTRFHHQKIPLIILLCGVPCVGKSTIATQLAQCLNLPNVLQTDMVYELLRTSTDSPLATTPVWARDFSSREELITEFHKECRIVRKGLNGDLSKTIKDGKPLIIEGFHLDPSIFLMDKDNGTVTSSQTDSNLAHVKPTVFPLGTNPRDPEHGMSKPPRDPDSLSRTSHAMKALVEDGNKERISETSKAMPIEQKEPKTGEVEGISSLHPQSQESCRHSNEGIREDKVCQGQSNRAENIPSFKLPSRAIVVPLVLRMADVDHHILLEECMASTSVKGAEAIKEQEVLVSKVGIIQDYLCSFESQGMKVVDISATTFPQTLDRLHSYLLECIERGCATPSPGAVS